jgi:hypothetical protein
VRFLADPGGAPRWYNAAEEDNVMKPDLLPSGALALPLVHVREEAPGRYTAQVVGLPEVRATAAAREEAIEQVRQVLVQWLSSGQLVPLAIPVQHPPMKPSGSTKDDPLEQEFLQDLARLRQEDLDRTLRAYEREDQGCSGTSSTPTT